MRKRVQVVFQDPDSSLNPRMTVQDHLVEALATHGLFQDEAQLIALMHKVQLSPDLLARYPFELSGGQKQRVSIARAISVEPELLILDEPLSSLDLSIRVQIIELLQRLKKTQSLSYFFITHDLATLRLLADHVAVLYFGHLVELMTIDELYRNPRHPYTKALLSAIPIADPKRERQRSRIILQGDLPSPLSPPTGCPFHTRCPMAQPNCRQQKPLLLAASEGHFVACTEMVTPNCVG